MKKHYKTSRLFDDITGILTVRHLAYVLGEKSHLLQAVAAQAESYYRPFIDYKRKKPREIDNPSGALKDIQTKICDRLLDIYPLSKGVYGAVSNHDTRLNARQHIRQKVVVRIDLKNCFHSTKQQWVYQCFRTRYHYSHQVAKLLSQLCTFNGSIPVGSPLSPMLVNVVYDSLWRKIEDYCNSEAHIFTVWIDDVIISGPHAERLIPKVKQLINKRGLRIGWNKLEIQRSHKGAQEVTGNTVNSEVGVSIAKRRDYAKIIRRALVDPKVAWKALGKLAHVKFVNKKQGRQLEKLGKIKVADNINHKVDTSFL